MRRSIIALVVALALPAAASAKGQSHTIAPPGDSGVQQYVETIPTAHGGKPSGTVHSGGSSHSGGGGGVSGGGGGGSSSTGGSGSGSISPTTQKALSAQGATGQAAAALAAATAPVVAHHRDANNGNGAGNNADVSKSLSAVSHATSASPVGAVFKALTGSSSSSGMGALLPILLIAFVLGFSGLAIARRRRTTT